MKNYPKRFVLRRPKKQICHIRYVFKHNKDISFRDIMNKKRSNAKVKNAKTKDDFLEWSLAIGVDLKV